MEIESAPVTYLIRCLKLSSRTFLCKLTVIIIATWRLNMSII